jgi:two-component system OmpR family response regulator
MRIVIIEDQPALADGIAKVMRDQGHAVDCLPDGRQGHEFLLSHSADVAIIDVNLPGMNGFDIVRAMRDRRDATPVLLLTARGETKDRVTGLDAGADDYLTKPFNMAELEARVRALARRRPSLAPNKETIGELRFDRKSLQLDGPAGTISLPRRELALFEMLLDRSGRIASKESIADHLYGTGAEVDLNAIELLVSRLRRKLEGTGVTIKTARGLGYMLDGKKAP